MNELLRYTDEELVRLTGDGYEAAFAAIYDRYWKSLFLAANNVLQDKNAAQDVVQEVFVSLWQRRSQVTITSLKAYLFQAVRFQVFKAIRAERNNLAFFQRLSQISNDILIEEPFLFKELESILQSVLDTVPADAREMFLLNRQEGYTYKQIAEKKDVSVKTVEKKMSLTLKQLRFGLDEAMMLAILIEAIR